MNSLNNELNREQKIQTDDVSVVVEKNQEFGSAIFEKIYEDLELGVELRFINHGSYCEFDMTYSNFWIEIYISRIFLVYLQG